MNQYQGRELISHRLYGEEARVEKRQQLPAYHLHRTMCQERISDTSIRLTTN
jgi:hypothetical protein